MSNITMVHGDTVEFDEVITDNEGPVDITTLTLRFMLKMKVTDADGDAIIELVTGQGITVIDGPNGKARVRVPPDATEVLPNTRQTIFWELQLEQDPNRWTVDGGKWKIVPELIQA